jgi:hypothetical protein
MILSSQAKTHKNQSKRQKGDVVAARKRPEHTDTQALLCGRCEYRLPGEMVANRQ